MVTRVEVFGASPSAPELPLGGFMPNDDSIQIKNIDGLGPVAANIESTQYATTRGELYQGSSVGKRNIVMTLGYNPDWEGDQTIASLRQKLYRYFMPQFWVKLRFFTDEYPPADIEGYVESFDPNIFSQDPEVQISVVCPKPDFIEADASIITGVVDSANEFEFEYVGTVDTGFELAIRSAPARVNYTGVINVTLMSPETPQLFSVNPVTISATQYFKLSTVPNAKRVETVAVIDGAVMSLIRQMSNDSVWPVIQPGPNILKVGATLPGQVWTLGYFNRFGGL